MIKGQMARLTQGSAREQLAKELECLQSGRKNGAFDKYLSLIYILFFTSTM